MFRLLPTSVALVTAVGVFARPAPGADAPTPRAVVQQLIDAVRGFKDDTNGTLTAADRAHNDEAKRLANRALAIREVSERALGDHWKRLTIAQRRDFTDLVTQLFERVAYPKSSGFFGDLSIEFAGDTVAGDTAVVKTTVRHPEEGLVGIDYELHRRGAQWVIDDILLDEVSLALDLRSQIQKVLREESYARLLERMRDKLRKPGKPGT